MQMETVVVNTCRCGFIAVAGTFDEALELHREHWDQEPKGDHKGYSMAVSAPMGNDLVAYLMRKASVYRDEWNALNFVAKWKAPEQPRFIAKPAHRWNIVGRFLDWFCGSIAEIHYGNER
jgi:hypothetical protein